MSTDRDVSMHYSQGVLLDRLSAALAEDGVEPGRWSIEALAPYDQFHARGLEATEEVARLLEVETADHILDVGSGIGGPARYIAHRFGCRVTGIDLTPEFCDVARELARRLGLDDRVSFEHGNALAMPFPNESFDGAFSMYVSMNIADKAGLYRGIHRVLKPGGRLALSEIAKGEGGEPDYPTPWAESARTSFLATPEETQGYLEASGFDVVVLRDVRERVMAFGARSRAMVERGEKPPHRAVQLIHAEKAAVAIANTARGVAEGRIVPIEILARKRG